MINEPGRASIVGEMMRNVAQARSGEIYRTLVRTLFGDFQILLLSILGTSFAMALTAYATGSQSIWLVMGASLFTGVVRMLVLYRFHQTDFDRGFSDEVARKWENVFTACAVGYALVMGTWVFMACVSNNTFAIGASFAVTFGNLIGVCCRSYPFARLVRYQLAAVFIPTVLGVELLGGPFMILGFLLIPYVFSISRFATDLRERQMNNILQRHRAEHTAGQLDNAINNVPQGIILFDDQMKLEVANEPVLRYLGVPQDKARGLSPKDLLSHVVQHGGLDDNDRAIANRWVQASHTEPFSASFSMNVEDQRRAIKLQSKPLNTGGLIMTTEDITREVETEKRVEQMSRVDWLTGLLNRNYFTSLLQEHLGSGAECCVIILRLDRFKEMNHVLGHQSGDMILTQVTRRLEQVTRTNGLVARHSGDEFAMALFGADALDAARLTADAIVETMASPFNVDGRQIRLGCKIGLAHTTKHDRVALSLLKYGDLALQKARKESGDAIVEFRHELAADAIRKVELQEDLRMALARDELEAWFQPLVSLKGRTVTTCEALMRWKHPRYGIVSPGIFIPMAEEMGLVGELGEWMLRQSCAACAAWPGDVRVAVNLSPAQFQLSDVVSIVQTVLAETGLDPARLELEITESLALDDMDGTVTVLNQFKAMGVSISLDDFGTGYSCLSYMNSLPLDKLKIDRAFVLGLAKGENGLTLLQAISAMGRQLKLKLVVEGVERAEELAVITHHDLADEVQGYFFAKPMPGPDILVAIQPDSVFNTSLRKSDSVRAPHFA